MIVTPAQAGVQFKPAWISNPWNEVGKNAGKLD